MTSTEPMTYKPGPELDVRLAKLFGWDVYTGWDAGTNSEGYVRARKSSDDPHGFDFKASRSWEGMRLAVEEMQRRDWWIFTGQTGVDRYVVNFWNHLTDARSEAIHSDSLPHAVCLAALSALQHVSKELDGG